MICFSGRNSGLLRERRDNYPIVLLVRGPEGYVVLRNNSFPLSLCFEKQTCRKQIRQDLSMLPYQQGWPSVFVWRMEHALLKRADTMFHYSASSSVMLGSPHVYESPIGNEALSNQVRPWIEKPQLMNSCLSSISRGSRFWNWGVFSKGDWAFFVSLPSNNEFPG